MMDQRIIFTILSQVFIIFIFNNLILFLDHLNLLFSCLFTFLNCIQTWWFFWFTWLVTLGFLGIA